MSENDDLLPSVVGTVVVRGNGVQSESAFEFSDDLFVCTASTHESPEPPLIKIGIGCNGRVFPVFFVHLQELKLVAIRRFVMDTFTEDPDSEFPVPSFDMNRRKKALDVFFGVRPTSAFADLAMEIQELPEGHFDGILCLSGCQDFHD